MKCDNCLFKDKCFEPDYVPYCFTDVPHTETIDELQAFWQMNLIYEEKQHYENRKW